MVSELGKDKGFKFMDGCGQFAEILNYVGVVSLDHGCPGLIIGIDREFTQYNETASPLGSPPVIANMSVG
jgi:hypothetical protein